MLACLRNSEVLERSMLERGEVLMQVIMLSWWWKVVKAVTGDKVLGRWRDEAS